MIYAKVRGTGIQRETIAAYLPAKYEVTGAGADSDGPYVLIEGTDDAGWTFDEYVEPRLASGGYFAKKYDPEVRSMMPLKAILATDSKGRAYPNGGEWMMEPKIDGWRFIFHVTDEGTLSYAGRNGSDRTGQPKVIEEAMAGFPPDTILDTELHIPGQPAARVAHALAHPDVDHGLEAIVFDVLRVAGTDATKCPYWERRMTLEKLSQMHFDDDGPLKLIFACKAEERVHDEWVRIGVEGSVVKRENSLYAVGRRSPDWFKFKAAFTSEARVTGFQPGKGKWADYAGAFEIVMLDDDGEPTVDTTCSTGTDALREEIKVSPEKYLGQIIEITHNGLMESGKPRHPRFVRLRPDLEDATNHEVKELKAMPEATTKKDTFEEFIGLSPVRSKTGRVRNCEQMSDDKFNALVAEMQGYDEVDPIGFRAVKAEATRRLGAAV